MLAIEKELNVMRRLSPLNRNCQTSHHINPYHQHSVQLQIPGSTFSPHKMRVKNKSEGRRAPDSEKIKEDLNTVKDNKELYI